MNFRDAATPHRALHWRAAVWGALLAGIVFLVVEMSLVVLTGGAAWGPPRMMAAILLGREVLPPPATFDSGVVTVGMLVHCALSLILAVLWGLVARPWPVGITALVGAAFGLAVYLVNFYGFTAIFPWFADARNAVTIVSHLVFGLVLALVYSMRVRA